MNFTAIDTFVNFLVKMAMWTVYIFHFSRPTCTSRSPMLALPIFPRTLHRSRWLLRLHCLPHLSPPVAVAYAHNLRRLDGRLRQCPPVNCAVAVPNPRSPLLTRPLHRYH